MRKEIRSRKIPSVMFSQHPDHASTPFWHSTPYIETHHELEECYTLFSEFGGEEMMWDWEGKLVDDSVVERLLTTYFDFFKDKPLGKEFFLTFRVPNPRIESGYRLGRAFMVILASQHLAHSANLTHPPLFEIILPMTESAEELTSLQKNYARIARAATSSFGTHGFSNGHIEVIPIFESVDTIIHSGDIIRQYIKELPLKQKKNLPYFRPFLARSDPALNSGIVPTTLAIKWALSEFAKVQNETDIPMYPIIAPGSLPFRGGLTPDTVSDFMDEFPGIKTLVVQSAFRYDYPKNEVKKAIDRIQDTLPKKSLHVLDASILPILQNVIPLFETPYKQRIGEIAPFIHAISKFIPKRRERVQHVGLFGYSRSVGEIQLPRAIGFTGSCYSLGIPPELFGTGIGLANAKKQNLLEFVESQYKYLRQNLTRAGKFFRKESLAELGLENVKEEVREIENYLGITLGPRTEKEKEHAELVSKIIKKIQKKKDPSEEIHKAARIRQSVG
jgi:phosphoenolpyruvate carboxylase